MKRISVLILTYNEEERIRKCLDSVRWADEIVIVDSESQDKTLDIVREYTDKAIVQPWLGFGAQRNLGLKSCTGDWILILDADERVSEELKEELLTISESDDFAAGYYIARKNYFLGRWIKGCKWYPDFTLRFFQRGKGRYNEKLVHEALEVNGKTAYLSQHLLHYTYKDLQHYIAKMNNYTDLEAKQFILKGRRVSPLDFAFRPGWTFFKMYFLKKGWQAGFPGFILSVLLSFYNYMKYVKAWTGARGNE